MRYLSARILLMVILISVGMTSKGAMLISASNRLPDSAVSPFAVIPFGNGSNLRFAQSFTADIEGRLLSASVTITSIDPDPTGLRLAVTALENGQPGPILASSPLEGLHINGGFTDIKALNAVAEFDTDQVMLEAQQVYALLLVVERTPSSFLVVLGNQASEDYTGGEILRSSNGEPFLMLPGGDLAFEVVVETIPEPMTRTTLLIGAVAAWSLSRWRIP